MTTLPPVLPTSFVIDHLKITGYLLNPDHRTGAAKAAFFLRCGFSPTQPDVLASALLEHPQAPSSELTSMQEGDYGTDLVYVGKLRSPRGATRPVRTIWQMPAGQRVARLVTAYPA